MTFWTPERQASYSEKAAREKYEREHFYSVNKAKEDAIKAEEERKKAEEKRLQDEVDRQIGDGAEKKLKEENKKKFEDGITGLET